MKVIIKNELTALLVSGVVLYGTTLKEKGSARPTASTPNGRCTNVPASHLGTLPSV
jgi:hypothetical protein